MNEIAPSLQEANVQVSAIGNGTVLMAQDFASAFTVEFGLYTDPSRTTFQAFGMKHGMRIGLSAVKRGVSAFRKGFRQGLNKGDPFQQGGVVLVDGAGEVRWTHIDDGPGDHADFDTLQAQVQRLST